MQGLVAQQGDNGKGALGEGFVELLVDEAVGEVGSCGVIARVGIVDAVDALSSKVPSLRQACRMAVTSAWAVGSLSSVTRFDAPATTLPSFTITAPKGPPPCSTLSSARRMASRMKRMSASVVFIPFIL